MAAALGFKSGSDDMRVGTDENREVFVLCGFCRPGASKGREAKPVTSKSGAVDFGQRYMHACQKTDINVSETAGFYKRGKAFQPLIHNIFRIY